MPRLPLTMVIRRSLVPPVCATVFVMPEGGTDPSKAFMTCTTCHNQHVMYVYKAPAGKDTGSAIAGGTYPTYFFINAPYNPAAGNGNPNLAASATICCQCHTGEQNEALA